MAHTVVSASGDGGLLAEMMLGGEGRAIYEHASRGPVTVEALAVYAGAELAGAKFLLQELISVDLVRQHEQVDGRAVLSAALDSPAVSSPAVQPRAVKIVAAGSTEALERSFVSALDATPLYRQSTMITAGRRASATVHFGRVDFPGHGLSVFMSGSPQIAPSVEVWDDVTRGAIGVVILVDPFDCRAAEIAATYCDLQGLPHVYAVWGDSAPVRACGGAQAWVRQALEIATDVSAVVCEDQERDAAIAVLKALAARARSNETD